MNVTMSKTPERVQSILKEVQQAREAIEHAPVSDVYESSEGRVLTKAQGFIGGGSLHHVSWMAGPDKLTAVYKDGEASVLLKSESFKKDTSKAEAAAAGLGALTGALIGDTKGKSPAALVVGALLGGFTAWAATRKTIEGPSEQRITRVSTDAHGITTEDIILGAKGEMKFYGTQIRHIGAPDAPKTEAEIKDFLDHLELK